jgi:hypothetical protein
MFLYEQHLLKKKGVAQTFSSMSSSLAHALLHQRGAMVAFICVKLAHGFSAGFDVSDVLQREVFDFTDYHILIDPQLDKLYSFTGFRTRVIHVPVSDHVTLQDAVPKSLWDVTDRIFLRPDPYAFSNYPMVIAMEFDLNMAFVPHSLVVLCDYRAKNPTCKLFERDRYKRHAGLIFGATFGNKYLYWEDLEFHAPELLDLSNLTEVNVGSSAVSIVATLNEKSIKAVFDDVEMRVFSLNLDVTVVKAWF